MSAPARPTPGRRELAFAALLALLFGAAPTVGDVGACGKTATDLNEATFAHARKSVDCQRCAECGLKTRTCQAACDPSAPSDVAWPSTCHPVFHDGEVCVRALLAASCRDYPSFVDDDAPTVPTECDFCHLGLDAGGELGDR